MTRPCVLAALLAAGEMDKDEWAAASRVVKNKLAALEAKLAAAQKVTAATPAAALAGREDAAELWAKLDLEAKRAVIRSLVTVTIGRQRRGVRRPCVCPRPGRSRSRDRGTCGPRAALAPRPRS